MKKWLITVWLIMVFSAVVALFWYYDMVYLLPTPVPSGYHPIGKGELVKLNGAFYGSKKPVFLHFFNPDCPCSKFNIKQFKKLVTQYNQNVEFVVVVMSNKTFTISQIQDRFNLKLPILFNDSIATSCGVYSTPQAVLIDANHRLYYRGNYNKSRYCTDEKTSFAQIAVQGLLNADKQLKFDPLALTPYGCQLPNCQR